MKKLIVVGLIGAAIVGGVVVASGASQASTPEGRACVKMADLCGEQNASYKDLDKCVDDMKKARKLAGDSSFDKSAKCVQESNSCAAATGCWMGGVGVGAMGELLKGFGTAITK